MLGQQDHTLHSIGNASQKLKHLLTRKRSFRQAGIRRLSSETKLFTEICKKKKNVDKCLIYT